MKRRMDQMARRNPVPLAEMNAIVDEAERTNAMAPVFIPMLRNHVAFLGERPYYVMVDNQWTRAIDNGLNADERREFVLNRIEEAFEFDNLTPLLRQRLIYYMDDRLYIPAAREERRVAPVQVLGRLALDPQNIHTAQVTEQMRKGLVKLIAADPGAVTIKGQPSTRNKIWYAFEKDNLHKNKVANLNAVKTDINSMWARSRAERECKYHKALRGLWEIISKKTGDEHTELVKRLWEECLESVGMCTQGHLARLTNVLVGYDEDFNYEESASEILQRRMAEISAMDVEHDEQVRLARSLLAELKVPVEKHEEWISAL
jgi:hypothetical protein